MRLAGAVRPAAVRLARGGAARAAVRLARRGRGPLVVGIRPHAPRRRPAHKSRSLPNPSGVPTLTRVEHHVQAVHRRCQGHCSESIIALRSSAVPGEIQRRARVTCSRVSPYAGSTSLAVDLLVIVRRRVAVGARDTAGRAIERRSTTSSAMNLSVSAGRRLSGTRASSLHAVRTARPTRRCLVTHRSAAVPFRCRTVPLRCSS